MEESGQLKFVSMNSSEKILKDSELGFDIFIADGHTEKQMIPLIKYKDKTIAFMADLLPTVGHLPLPFVMGYDTRPLLTLDEKEQFLNLAADNDFYLFLIKNRHGKEEVKVPFIMNKMYMMVLDKEKDKHKEEIEK